MTFRHHTARSHQGYHPRRTGFLVLLLALCAGVLAVVTVATTATTGAIVDARTDDVAPADPVPSTAPPAVPAARPAPAPAAPAPVAAPPTPSAPPDAAPEPLTTGDVAAAEASTVSILNDTCGLGGSGWVYAPGYVATNAHVVRGDGGPVELSIRGGRPIVGRVVAIDPATDVAVVHAPGLDAVPLRWSADPAPKAIAVAWVGYPGATLTVGRGGIRTHGRVSVDGKAIDAYLLTVRGIKGMSGGPMVGPGGVVHGMNVGVADTDSAAIVQTGAHIAPLLTAARGRTSPVATGTCA